MPNSSVKTRTRSRIPHAAEKAAAAATPSPHPAGNRGDLQSEQEDVGINLEGKFDGVAKAAESKGKSMKNGKKKKTVKPPQVTDTGKEGKNGSKKQEGAAKRKAETLARQVKKEKESAALNKEEKQQHARKPAKNHGHIKSNNKLKDLRNYTKCFYNYTNVVSNIARQGTTQNVDLQHRSRLS